MMKHCVTVPYYILKPVVDQETFKAYRGGARKTEIYVFLCQNLLS